MDKRRIILICLVGLMIFSLVFLMAIKFTGSASAISKQTIQLISVSVLDIQNANTSEELEQLLFPSGMKLPTKYMDFYSFADVGETSWEVAAGTYEFLTTNFPTEGNRYTLAEVKAAQIFCSWYSTLNSTKRSKSTEDVIALENLFSNSEIGLYDEVYDVRLTNFETLKTLIASYVTVLNIKELEDADSLVHKEKYVELLEMHPEYNTVMSMGVTYGWDFFADEEPGGVVVQMLKDFYDSRLTYCELLGLQFTPSGMKFFSDPETTEVIAPASPAETIEETPEVTVSPEPMPSPSPSIESVSPIEAAKNQPNKAVTDFATGYTSDDVPERRMGWKDVGLIVSLVIVGVTVVYAGIVDWIRKRNRPKWGPY